MPRLKSWGDILCASETGGDSLWHRHREQTLGASADFHASYFMPRARVDDGGVITATVAHGAVATIRRKGDPVGAFPDLYLG